MNQLNFRSVLSDAPTNAPAWSVPLLGPGQVNRQTPTRMDPVSAPSAETPGTLGTVVSKGIVTVNTCTGRFQIL